MQDRRSSIDIDKLRQMQLKAQQDIAVSTKKKNDDTKVKKDQIDHAKFTLEQKNKLRQQAKADIIKKILEDDTPTIINTTTIKNDPLKKEFSHKVKLIKDESPVVPIKQVQETQEKLSYTLQMETVSAQQIAAYKKRVDHSTAININDKFEGLYPRISNLYLIYTIPLLVIVVILIYIKVA